MKKFIKPFTNILALITLFAVIYGCNSGEEGNKYLKLSSLKIEDSIRHYYPILRGSKLNLTVKIENTGEYPLKIYNVLPSCGCILTTYPKRPIAVGAAGFVQMEYESGKNIGYVAMYTTILANTNTYDHTIFFDVNVVSNALYTKDYEEVYNIKQEEESSLVTEMVEGSPNQRGYVVDSLYGISF